MNPDNVTLTLTTPPPMDTTATAAMYAAITQHLPEAPNLAIVQQRQPLPEQWPVMLVAIHTQRGMLTSIEVGDGTHTAHCTTSIPDLAQRLTTMEAGAIVHVLGGEPRHSDAHGAYVLDIQQVCTLKEYDTLVKNRAKEDQRRAEQQQAWLEETYGDGASTIQTADPATNPDAN